MPEALRTLREAAVERAQGMHARADRPRKRRASPSAADAHVRAPRPGEFRADGGRDGWAQFSGYASVTEQPYEMYDFFGPYDEVVAAGAFAKTLGSNPDVPLVLQHDPLRRLAATMNDTLELREDDTGLLSLADLDPEDPDVQYATPKLRSGVLNEMSFAFSITAAEWSPDWTVLRILEVDLHRGDVSIVGFGANPATSGGLRAGDFTDALRSMPVEELRHLERKLNLTLRDRGQQRLLTLDDLR